MGGGDSSRVIKLREMGFMLAWFYSDVFGVEMEGEEEEDGREVHREERKEKEGETEEEGGGPGTDRRGTRKRKRMEI